MLSFRVEYGYVCERCKEFMPFPYEKWIYLHRVDQDKQPVYADSTDNWPEHECPESVWPARSSFRFVISGDVE